MRTWLGRLHFFHSTPSAKQKCHKPFPFFHHDHFHPDCLPFSWRSNEIPRATKITAQKKEGQPNGAKTGKGHAKPETYRAQASALVVPKTGAAAPLCKGHQPLPLCRFSRSLPVYPKGRKVFLLTPGRQPPGPYLHGPGFPPCRPQCGCSHP